LEEPHKEKNNQHGIRWLVAEERYFWQAAGSMRLRRYQQEVAEAVIDSVLRELGLSIVVMFPRQSGKNELQAQLEAYFLVLFNRVGGNMVKVSPTWKPQSINAMQRLERVLDRNRVTARHWSKESGYIYRLGAARMIFLSGAPESHIVGATADLLLEVDEAQSVRADKFDRDIAPMAASTNATRVFWGTAWTADTLLARELRAARRAELADGLRRCFVLSAEQVGSEVPAYRRFVEAQVVRLGRQNPMVKTQYFSEELDAECGMFPPQRAALMQGTHARLRAPRPGWQYALLLDVAGEDEGQNGLENPLRDLTALTVVEIDPTGGGEGFAAYTYRAVDRKQWIGVKHTALYAELLALARHWQAVQVVVDATGVGAGLASFLERALPGRVTRFVFSAVSKSRLGWDFLSVVETGRWQEYAPQGADAEQEAFFRQLAHCKMDVQPGADRRMRWGVPDGARDPATGELLHDDLIISAALCALLDGMALTSNGPALVIPAADPLEELDYGF